MRLVQRLAALTAAATIAVLAVTTQPALARADGEVYGVLQMPTMADGVTAFEKLSTDSTARGQQLRPQRSLHEVARLKMKATLDAAKDPASAGSMRKSASLLGYDAYTFKDCRENNDPAQDETAVDVKNHFSVCIVSRGRYSFYQEILGVDVWVGDYTFRMTILGQGQLGLQQTNWVMEMDDWDADGIVNPSAELSVDFNCVNYPNAACSSSNFTKEDTIGGWQRDGFHRATFNTSASAGGGDGIHYDFDKVNYHDFQLVMDSSEGDFELTHPFRCDAAAYASGGGCIFHTVDAVMHYSLSGSVGEVAAHIKQAQDDPENVKPGGIGTEIAGGKASGKPLTRLVETATPESQTYYNRTGNIIERDCARYFTAEERAGKDCDEYPFHATWEGAAYTEANPGAKWKYSVKPLNRSQNRVAGTDLQLWYLNDHILAFDPFWVQIDP
jgi:hypothetical protein